MHPNRGVQILIFLVLSLCNGKSGAKVLHQVDSQFSVNQVHLNGMQSERVGAGQPDPKVVRAQTTRAARRKLQQENVEVNQSVPELLNVTKSEEFSWRYLDNNELQDFLHDYAKRCSHISHLYSIGKSANGFPLWVLEITDSPQEPEPEPHIKYVGNLHGDEPVGRQLMLYLATWLCDNYLKDDQATNLVKHAHLHLLPSMNPDGFALHTRNNLHGVDLNRDFPDQFLPINDNESLRQPEVLAVMQWTRTHKFVLSASFHEGALVANYPWDGNSQKMQEEAVCPDDATFRYLAKVYSYADPIMWRSAEFREGITNGAAWYPINGGMQDWNYIHAGCFDLTVEMNEDKWPPASALQRLWEEHRPALLALASHPTKSGVHGTVKSAATGGPLMATVRIAGINSSVTSGAKFGDFHRLLLPGTHQVTVSAPGHSSSSANATVLASTPTRLDFLLEPLESATNLAAKVALLRGTDAEVRGGAIQGGASGSLGSGLPLADNPGPSAGIMAKSKFLDSSGQAGGAHATAGLEAGTLPIIEDINLALGKKLGEDVTDGNGQGRKEFSMLGIVSQLMFLSSIVVCGCIGFAVVLRCCSRRSTKQAADSTAYPGAKQNV